MRADSQFAVVEAVIKGYNKWVSAHGKAPQHDVRTCTCHLVTQSLTYDAGVESN
jgi:hypothetical protein